MVLALLIFFGLIISWKDLRTHRIPNRTLIYFSIFTAAISYRDLSEFAQLCASSFLIAFLLSIVMGIGMGDVKLIALLVPLVARDHELHLTLLLICISFTSIVAAAITILKRGTISRSIPWAPSLFSGAILYLATR